MLVSFIGSPCSGKTTCAALVFSALKDAGASAEFLPEQARLYIAERRAATNADVVLTDLDQIMIMKRQFDIEAMMLKACRDPAVVLVTDSSPLNSLLYMSEDARLDPEVRAIVDTQRQRQALTFYVHTVNPGLGSDPNRIHDIETSRRIDAELPVVLGRHAPWLNYVQLLGSSRHRADMALSFIFSELLSPRILACT